MYSRETKEEVSDAVETKLAEPRPTTVEVKVGVERNPEV